MRSDVAHGHPSVLPLLSGGVLPLFTGELRVYGGFGQVVGVVAEGFQTNADNHVQRLLAAEAGRQERFYWLAVDVPSLGQGLRRRHSVRRIH